MMTIPLQPLHPGRKEDRSQGDVPAFLELKQQPFQEVILPIQRMNAQILDLQGFLHTHKTGTAVSAEHIRHPQPLSDALMC